jgi:hypothetical protein
VVLFFIFTKEEFNAQAQIRALGERKKNGDISAEPHPFRFSALSF